VNHLNAEEVEETTAERNSPIATARIVKQLPQLIADRGLANEIRKSRSARQRTEPGRRHACQMQRMAAQAAQQCDKPTRSRDVWPDDHQRWRNGYGFDESAAED
jgi:hypothetical protein